MKNEPYQFVSEDEVESYYTAIAVCMIFASVMLTVALL